MDKSSPRIYPERECAISERELLDLLAVYCNAAQDVVEMRDVLACTTAKSPIEAVTAIKDLKNDVTLGPYRYLVREQGLSLLRKYPFKGNSRDRRAAAYLKFLEGEAICKEVNDRLESLKFAGQPATLLVKLEQARKLIRRIVGGVNVENLMDCCRFGPGTNVGIRDHRKTDAVFKLGSRITITPNLIPIAGLLLREFEAWDRCSLQGWSGERFELTDGNKITFVPKNAFTDRTIAAEPLLNSFFQLGLGSLLKRQLLKIGIDLRRGATKNRRLAKEGSIDRNYSTIDISNASGCISFNLVRWLLPDDWFQLLNLFRSAHGSCPDEFEVKYEQFSSMGNGATFELESLIFYALIRTIVPYNEEVSVFGDDLIVPTQYFDDVVELLSCVGFATNLDKTFTGETPFRESCGMDYLSGTLVRPLFITKEISDVPSVVELANRVRTIATESVLSHRPGEGSALLRGVWNRVIRKLPLSLRNKISTPPYCPGGLWKGGLSTPRDVTGALIEYEGLVITPISTSVLNDDSLLAGRLYGNIGGHSATLRKSTKWKVSPRKFDNGGRTWEGWA